MPPFKIEFATVKSCFGLLIACCFRNSKKAKTEPCQMNKRGYNKKEINLQDNAEWCCFRVRPSALGSDVQDQVKRRGFSFVNTLYYHNHLKANSVTAYGANNKSNVQFDAMD
jgi:hypothetical protein